MSAEEKNIGEMLRNRREELKKTQKEVAEYVGVSEGTISRWETGSVDNMRRDRIAALAEILSISPLKILGMEDGKDSKSHVSATISFDHTSPLWPISQVFLRVPSAVQKVITEKLSELDKTFSRKVSKLLRASGDINNFMGKTGLPFEIVGKLMQGEAIQIAPDEVERVAEYFHVDVVDLFFDNTAYHPKKELQRSSSPVAKLLKREVDASSAYHPTVQLLIKALDEYLSCCEQEPYYDQVQQAIICIKTSNLSSIFQTAINAFQGDLDPNIVARYAVKELYENRLNVDIMWLRNAYAVQNFVDFISRKLKLSKTYEQQKKTAHN